LVRGKEDGIVVATYREGRARIARGEAAEGEWAVETKRILQEIGLGEEWETEQVGSAREWARMVKNQMGVKEEVEWREGLLRKKQKSKEPKIKLMRYARIKKRLKQEWYLQQDRVWVRRWVKLRAGVEELEVEMGRRYQQLREDRVCRCCDEGEVEDEEHLLEVCQRWKEERGVMWRRVKEHVRRKTWGEISSWGRRRRVDWLMAGNYGGEKSKRQDVLRGVVRLLHARSKHRGGGSCVSQRSRGQREKDRSVVWERNNRAIIGERAVQHMQGFAERAREERARRAEEAHTAALEGATAAFEAERERALRRADAHAAALEGR
jgi:hypothetical protein